jgi:hypothetical protein
MTDNKFGITKSITGLDNHSTFIQLEGFNTHKCSEQLIWWDTFSIDQSLCVEHRFEDQEKGYLDSYSKEATKVEIWF